MMLDASNPLTAAGKHCALCEWELTHTPAERARAVNEDVAPRLKQ